MARTLRVLIDGRMTVGRFSGIARFVTSLVEQFSSRDDTEVTVLCGCEVPPEWHAKKDLNILTTDFSRNDRTPMRRRRWEEAVLPGIIRRARVDVFHATWNYGIPSRCSVPSVLTVHDLIGWRASARELGGWSERMALRRAMRCSIQRASRITTVSNHTRNSLLAHVSVNPYKIITIYNGAGSQMDSPLLNRDLNAPAYALYVGGYERRKNLLGLLRAFETYWNKFDDPLLLKLTGSLASLPSDVLQLYEGMRWRQRVTFVGRPGDAELSALYRGASLLALLSHDEGFGLPALEAMAYGCPVLVSNRAALPELVADAGLVVDPDDSSEVAQAIHQLRNDVTLRKLLIGRGRARAAEFTWAAAAERMRLVYAEAHAGTASNIRWRPPTHSWGTCPSAAG